MIDRPSDSDLGQAQSESHNSESAVDPLPDPSVGNPDQAWRILDLTNGWIRHGEAKAAATIAAAGVSAGVLYNLHKDVVEPNTWTQVGTVSSVILIAIAGLAAAWSLRPRLWSRSKPTSSLYFSHIARQHGRSAGAEQYRALVRRLTVDEEALTDQIADQIWANAHVARAKFSWANVGLTAILLALFALAFTAFAVSAAG